ncbi:hypothetical protein BRD18_04700 [Halobacteriales archaeon SW_7_71_33]|nr:MAG: hypothetical protein BRD18_04700 [Halobacteriales archaeon SW_7_71_33]
MSGTAGTSGLPPVLETDDTVDLSATVVDQGETSGALVRLVFYHDDVAVRTVTLPMGRVEAGERLRARPDHRPLRDRRRPRRGAFLSSRKLRRVRG